MNFIAWAEPDPKCFRVPFDYPAHSLQETVIAPNQWYQWKAETLKVCLCLLLVWRVCDQAFGRYRPLNGTEKWSRDQHENWKFAYRHTWKNSLLSKMLFFSIYDEKWRSYRGKTVSEQWRHYRRFALVECLAVLNWRSSSYILLV